MDFQRQPNETDFEYKFRLCKAKIEKVIDLDWQEIVDLLHLDIHPDHLRKTAYGMMEYHSYLKDDFGVATRILSISDLHVPFQKPIDTFSEFRNKIDILQINGDVGDCQAISKFPKVYRISPMEELILTREYLIELIDYLQPKKVIVNYGNHDLRFQNYLAKSLDTDLLELMPKTSLELIILDGFKHYDKKKGTKVEYTPLVNVFDNIEIQYIDSWFCQIGKTIFCHPLAFSAQPMKTSERAMQYFRNEGYDFTSLVMAHTHRVGEYMIGNTVLYEQGCCCETQELNYTDGKLTPSQQEGFLFVAQDSKGELLRDKTKLIGINKKKQIH